MTELTDQEITAFATDLESFRVERKRNLSSQKSKVEEAICAFANDLPALGVPGVLMIGVEDDGTPSGTPITDQLLQDLAAIRSNGAILPFPRMTVEKRTLQGVDVAVVPVHPSLDTPLRLRGRVCVRVGPRRDTATRDEERILTERRKAWNSPFDQTPVHGATLDDLDLELFHTEFLPNAVAPEVLRENSRSTAEQLAALHLATPDAVPNAAGLLIPGNDPTTLEGDSRDG